MGRRYLSLSEAESALNRGKSIAVFLEGFLHEGKKCISWASFSLNNGVVTGKLWAALDQGDQDYLDIWTFESVFSEYDEPAKETTSPNLTSACVELGIEPSKFVNESIVQDEYGDYLKNVT
ncbi:TPA: hypothetical protein ACGUP1_004499 [Vibrio vulnificus]|uniref:hypothetical protein n=1 Tax=Vibrio vulnificus TaxID=672 RepID=UPI001FAEE83F|nr:hypothetical protein [Vibrio vulnificus]MCJ0807011.1 hypothetical protein [Vibrio vulnificus]HDY7531045.1 hypothetical protein [Vibrio vulnificus]